jgi:hypothetical protein
LQGDTGDGGIGRDQLAAVLVRALLTDTAIGKTFELFAHDGPAPSDWSALFAPLDADTDLEGVHDRTRVPMSAEPVRIQQDVEAVRAAVTHNRPQDRQDPVVAELADSYGRPRPRSSCAGTSSTGCARSRSPSRPTASPRTSTSAASGSPRARSPRSIPWTPEHAGGPAPDTIQLDSLS